MSIIIRVGGKVTETVGGKILNYAKGPIIYSSNKQVIETAPNGITYGPAEPHPLPEVTTLAIAEIRPFKNYDGQYGIDWFRISEAPLPDIEEPYKENINGAYEKDNSYGYDKKEAYELLRYEYDPILMKPMQEGAEPREYYVTRLNLFPKSYSDTVNCDPKLPCEAELRAFVTLYDDLDSLEFEYNKDLVSVDPPVLKDTQRCNKTFSLTPSFKVTCLKEITDPMEIMIYAYPKGSKQKQKAEQTALRTLAGKILLMPNHAPVRRKQKLVLVRVKVAPDDKPKFSPEEKLYLHRVLHQCLVEPEIEEALEFFPAYKYPDFIQKYVTQKGEIDTDKSFFPGTLKELFLERKNEQGEKVYTKYQDSLPVFLVDRISRSDVGVSIGGAAAIFIGRSNTTCAHEALHIIGLMHAHREAGRSHLNRNQKFVFFIEYTTNIMSYNTVRNSLWQWQWELVQNPIDTAQKPEEEGGWEKTQS